MDSEGVAEKTEFRGPAWLCGDREYVEAKGLLLKPVAGNVGTSCPDDALLFHKTHRVFGRIGVLASLDFDENNGVTIPGNNIDLTMFDPVG